MSSATTGEDLAALFGEHGTVTSAKVITDRETGNSKCFGFVEMEDETEGMNAINALNETEFQGRKIVVKKELADSVFLVKSIDHSFVISIKLLPTVIGLNLGGNRQKYFLIVKQYLNNNYV